MAWLFLAQAITAATGTVPIASVDQARAMSPQALASALLAPGHPPVDFVQVAPTTMDPPPPPDAPPQFRVVLHTVPAAAAESGFCRRSRIEAIVLSPGPAATAKIERVRTLHQLADRCVGGNRPYGDYQDTASMAAIRDLAVQRAAKRPTIEVEVYDRMPPAANDARYTDGLRALRAIRLDHVGWAGPARSGGSLPDEQRQRCAGRVQCEQIGFYADRVWSGVVTRERGRITHVWLRRQIPPPF